MGGLVKQLGDMGEPVAQGLNPRARQRRRAQARGRRRWLGGGQWSARCGAHG